MRRNQCGLPAASETEASEATKKADVAEHLLGIPPRRLTPQRDSRLGRAPLCLVIPAPAKSRPTTTKLQRNRFMDASLRLDVQLGQEPV